MCLGADLNSLGKRKSCPSRESSPVAIPTSTVCRRTVYRAVLPVKYKAGEHSGFRGARVLTLVALYREPGVSLFAAVGPASCRGNRHPKCYDLQDLGIFRAGSNVHCRQVALCS
jgi:hypothetical protein